MKLVYPPCPVANTRGEATEPLLLTSAPACQKDCTIESRKKNGKKMAQMVSVSKTTASIVVVDRKSQEKYWP